MPQYYQKTDTVSESTVNESTESIISFSYELSNPSSNNKTDTINENKITNTKSLPVLYFLLKQKINNQKYNYWALPNHGFPSENNYFPKGNHEQKL